MRHCLFLSLPGSASLRLRSDESRQFGRVADLFRFSVVLDDLPAAAAAADHGGQVLGDVVVVVAPDLGLGVGPLRGRRRLVVVERERV